MNFCAKFIFLRFFCRFLFDFYGAASSVVLFELAECTNQCSIGMETGSSSDVRRMAKFLPRRTFFILFLVLRNAIKKRAKFIQMTLSWRSIVELANCSQGMAGTWFEVRGRERGRRVRRGSADDVLIATVNCRRVI